jgi:hypothetical protein
MKAFFVKSMYVSGLNIWKSEAIHKPRILMVIPLLML